MDKPVIKHGQLYWTDLTLDEPELVKAFYKKVLGWEEMPVAMKEGEDTYNDYAMVTAEEAVVSGICHHRGVNKGIPPQWITYFYVDNVAQALATCLEAGGKLIKSSKKKDGSYNYVIVEDPQGCVFGMGNM